MLLLDLPGASLGMERHRISVQYHLATSLPSLRNTIHPYHSPILYLQTSRIQRYDPGAYTSRHLRCRRAGRSSIEFHFIVSRCCVRFTIHGYGQKWRKNPVKASSLVHFHRDLEAFQASRSRQIQFPAPGPGYGEVTNLAQTDDFNIHLQRLQVLHFILPQQSPALWNRPDLQNTTPPRGRPLVQVVELFPRVYTQGSGTRSTTKTKGALHLIRALLHFIWPRYSL